MSKYDPPARNKQAFNCPHCGAFAHQRWTPVGTTYSRPHPNGQGFATLPGLSVSQCDHCDEYSMWVGELLVFPFSSPAPLASEDMPPDILSDYNEARNVLPQSPRSSAALLRLVIQKLCIHQGKSGKDLNADIGSLVSDGLRRETQQALDAVRVVGNNAVHPGELDLRDDTDTALTLFDLVNIIVYDLLTRKQIIDNVYSRLPESKLKQIEERDNRKA